jgi:hypothetical protein
MAVLLLDGLGRSSNGLIGGDIDLDSFNVAAIELQAVVFTNLLDSRFCIRGRTASNDDVILAGRE